MRQLSPIQLWNQYGAFLTDKLGVADAIFAEEFARHTSLTLRRDFPSARRLMQTALLARQMLGGSVKDDIIPRSLSEVRPFANFVAYGMSFVSREELGMNICQFADLMKAELTKQRSVMEKRLNAIEKHMVPVDYWVNNRLRHTAGACVDIWFGQYKKRYKPLKGWELDQSLSHLENAAADGIMNAFLVFLKGEFQGLADSFVSHLSRLPSQFEPSTSLIQQAMGDIFLGLVDTIEVFAARLGSKHVAKLIEEGIYEEVGKACRRLVDDLERYSPTYESRKDDYHLYIIQFDAKGILYFDIILTRKDPMCRRSLKELCLEAGLPLSEVPQVYAFKRRLGL